ncbi:MAG TPA: acyl-homoserine-lactone synthase [Dongiaceae bacterium]|jgi:acyl homoserine lactone synthase|nr:acyl-homoserine-lactone synthase [Dongiaceae bacterium]
MIETVTWENVHLHGSLWADHHRLRHKLFIERLRWQLNSEEDMEYDEFDTPATTYLFATQNSQLAGIARLIPTTKPYMIEKLWPFFMESLPHDNTVWEASRFGIDPTLSAREKAKISMEIVLGCQEFGLKNRIERFMVVMPTQIIRRVIGNAGCPYHYLGEPQIMDGMRIAAAAIEVSADIVAHIRHRLADIQPERMAA